MAEVAGQEIVTKVRDILAPLGLELHPFKVCKYLKNLLMVIRPLVENEVVPFTVVIFFHMFFFRGTGAECSIC